MVGSETDRLSKVVRLFMPVEDMFAFYGRKQGAASRNRNTRNRGKRSGFTYSKEYGRGIEKHGYRQVYVN